MHTVRKVLPNEYYKYREHLKNLDSASKYLRFGYSITDAMIDDLCDKIDSDKDHHILFCIEDDDLKFIAVGHIALENEMELALSVLSHAQGKGMGNALIRRCIFWCRTHGILKGCMVCLSSNAAIKHLCAKNGIRMTSEDGETLASVEFEQAGVDTYLSEATNINLAVLDWISKRIYKPWASAI